WPWMEFLDEGNFGLGQRSVPVAAGREVPANAVTLSPLLADSDARDFGRVLHDRIYVYERDAGLLMYYRQDDATVQARATELVVGRAVEARRNADDANARSWTIYNPSASGPAGRPAGYVVVPGENAATIFPRARERGPVGFTFHHLWVTPYRDGEFFAGGRYP